MSDWRLLLVLALVACTPADEAGNSPVAADPIATGPAPSAIPETVRRESVFTDLTIEKCRIVEENKEEGPYWLRRCPGHAGWQLEWSDSDLRQGLDLISPVGRKTELRLSDLVAKGAFNSLGQKIEWRGEGAPEALIVRMNVANGVEPRLPDISRLAVVRLTKTPCLVAVIEPGPRQNERAREIANGPLAECLAE